ncbi:hypothetical protein B0H10DRAFT_2061467 [Mycena sp. CBHHK59/15]|nr:hypothetical protein B0H10DRAFT_2061467 [Mycena sp. CBHHK59/15]
MDLEYRFPLELWLKFYPYDFRPLQEELDDHLERLYFWSSPQIAPHVHRCSVTRSLKNLSGSVQGWQQPDDDGSAAGPHLLMYTFFKCFLNFTGLERFYANNVQFSHTGIANLCTLPALTHVEFFQCTVAPGEHIDPHSLTLRVATFSTYYDMNDLWVSLVSPETIRELVCSNLLPMVKPGGPPFPNVHALTLLEGSPMQLSILTRFPGVRLFSIDYERDLDTLTAEEASSLFPVLEEYCGPGKSLHIFVQRTTLTRINIIDTCIFRDLMTELHGITALPKITSLTAWLYTSSNTSSAFFFGKPQLDTLFTLKLTLWPEDEEDGEFTPEHPGLIKALISSVLLPTTLEHLSLEWSFDCAYHANPVPPSSAETLDFADLRDTLLAKCSALTYISLDGHHFFFLLWSAPSAWEATAHNHEDAKVVRAQKYAHLNAELRKRY